MGPMHITRIALATLAGLVAYFAVGGAFFAVPALREEFARYPSVFRSGEAMNSVMAIGIAGIVLAIGAATVLFARLHPDGAGVEAGVRFGVLIATFVLGALVIHNYMNLNVGWRIAAWQGAVYSLEWIAVGAVIGLVYRR
jgi:hypothetical protein